jgi:dihydrofolate synthase / folylpolyglutamate synthase
VPYPKFGQGSALERTTRIAARLGIDLTAFGVRGAVIVGSNGKGSTAAMTAAVLQHSGRSVGLFTSPHLFALNERFRVDGEDISDEDLETHWDRVAAATEAVGETLNLGGFEFLFLVAADWFVARGCASTVWEAGLGGRLDPVRLIAARRVALTSLDLEHTTLLGDTLEQIAREKIDAAPEGATLFAPSDIAVRETVAAYGASHRLNVRFVSNDSAPAPPLAGAHQRSNAALAVALARTIAPLSDDEVGQGLAATRWPGRLEVLDQAPLIVIDVGHTPAGVAASLQAFEIMCGARNGVLVCGASADKDAGALIGALAPAFSTIICASARHKGAPAATIAAFAASANPAAEVVIADSIADSRRLALAKARGTAGAIYVAGGLFLAAEFKAVHLGRDPALLAFF